VAGPGSAFVTWMLNTHGCRPPCCVLIDREHEAQAQGIGIAHRPVAFTDQQIGVIRPDGTFDAVHRLPGANEDVFEA
jgi:hypothetical protein